jgi:predicted phage gp36 major capsid-like protein
VTAWPLTFIASAKTSHYTIAALVDPDKYIIVDRVGMNVEIIPNIFGAGQGNLPTGQRGLYAMWRNTAQPLTSDVGRVLAYKT